MQHSLLADQIEEEKVPEHDVERDLRGLMGLDAS